MNECFWSFYKLGHYLQFTKNRVFQIIGKREEQWRTIFSAYIPKVYFKKESTTHNGNGVVVLSFNLLYKIRNYRFVLFSKKIGSGYNPSDFGDCC